MTEDIKQRVEEAIKPGGVNEISARRTGELLQIIKELTAREEKLALELKELQERYDALVKCVSTIPTNVIIKATRRDSTKLEIPIYLPLGEFNNVKAGLFDYIQCELEGKTFWLGEVNCALTPPKKD